MRPTFLKELQTFRKTNIHFPQRNVPMGITTTPRVPVSGRPPSGWARPACPGTRRSLHTIQARSPHSSRGALASMMVISAQIPQNPSNTLKIVQTPSNTLKFLPTPSNTLKFSQTPSNSFKHPQILSNTLKHPQILSNTRKHPHNPQNPLKI